MKLAIASAAIALAASSASAAATPGSSSTPYKLIATQTNSNGLLDKDIHANGGRLWVNKATKTYCPNSVNQSGGNCNNFNPKLTTYRTNYGVTELNVADPGGQELFIGGRGIVRITEGHDGQVPDKATLKGVRKILLSGNRTWLCNEDGAKGADADKYYLVVAPSKNAKPLQATSRNTCTRVKLVSKPAPKAKQAWLFQ